MLNAKSIKGILVAGVCVTCFAGTSLAQTKPGDESLNQNTGLNVYKKSEPSSGAPKSVKPTREGAAKVDMAPDNEYTKAQDKAPKGQKPSAASEAQINKLPVNEYTKAQDRKSKKAPK